jgi:serine protease Do
VVGINTAIYTDTRQAGNIGIGFAIPINAVRNLLPQLQTGKVTRGVIGVSVRTVPADAVADFGLSERTGALVATVTRGGPAARAGMEPGDIILEFNGVPVRSQDELVRMVVATKPGTTVPVKVWRDKRERMVNLTVDELDLESESTTVAGRPQTEETTGVGFGITLGPLTPDVARQLRIPSETVGVLVTDVEPGSPAARAPIVRGDVILQVNRVPVSTPAEAGRELDRVDSGSTAFLLILRRGQETFVTMRKE